MTDAGHTEREVLERSFRYFDSDSNGRIDLAEFTGLVRRMGFLKPDPVIEHAFSAIDIAGRGFIDFDQFSAWWKKSKGGPPAVPDRPAQ